jgi:hypothetical protein
MKPIKLKPRNHVAKATQSGGGRHVDKRHEWSAGEENFNLMLDELHIQSVEEKEAQEAVRKNLSKLMLQRRVKW